MEALSLEKFQDVKLENKQLSFVHAGDTCTGGGSGTYLTSDGQPVTMTRINSDGSICTAYAGYHYDSDSIDDCGHTSYSGYQSGFFC